MPQDRPAVMNKEFLGLVPKAKELAQKHGINPALFLSLIQRESSGDQSKVSRKGALGLTQLLPVKADELGVDPTDPIQNMEGGARFLGQLLRKFKNREDLALAAYNAGPNRVRNGKVPQINETKKYIEAITGAKPYYESPYFPLTDQARHNAYGEGNINLFSRPLSKNPDGSSSTLYSMSGEDGGKEVLFPGVDAKGGGIISGSRAFDQYKDSGKHLGKFNSVPEADTYAENLHKDAEKGFYTPPLASSHKDVDPKQLGSVLNFMLTGEKDTLAPDKSYIQKLLEH